MGKKCNLVVFHFAAAVKFGRMSKKQREKVEDEVRYHKAQMRQTPDSSVFEQQTPSSSVSDPFPTYPGTGYAKTGPRWKSNFLGFAA